MCEMFAITCKFVAQVTTPFWNVLHIQKHTYLAKARRTDASLSTHYLFGDDGRRGDLHPMRKSPLPHPSPPIHHPSVASRYWTRQLCFPRILAASTLLIFIPLFVHPSGNKRLSYFCCFFVYKPRITIEEMGETLKRLNRNRKTDIILCKSDKGGFVLFPGTYAMIDLRGAHVRPLFQREI